MLCSEIMRTAGDIVLDEWNFFLRGAAGMDTVTMKCLCHPMWKHVPTNRYSSMVNADIKALVSVDIKVTELRLVISIAVAPLMSKCKEFLFLISCCVVNFLS